MVDGSDHRFRKLIYDLLTVSVCMQAVRNQLAARIGNHAAGAYRIERAARL